MYIHFKTLEIIPLKLLLVITRLLISTEQCRVHQVKTDHGDSRSDDNMRARWARLALAQDVFTCTRKVVT